LTVRKSSIAGGGGERVEELK